MRKRYVQWAHIRDEYDCGYHLARYMSSRLALAEDKLNEAIRMCRQLDPLCTLKEIEE